MCDECGEQCNREDKIGEHGKRMHKVLSKEERTIVVPTAPRGTQSRVQNEEEDNPRTGPNKKPGDAELFDTETSSELEEGGKKHKAPDEKRRPVKTINDKEGEVFGPETADLDRGSKKLEQAVEGSYERNKTHVETKPPKASEELFETDVSDMERGPDPGGGRLQEFEQELSLKEHTNIHKEGGNFTCPHCQKTFTE